MAWDPEWQCVVSLEDSTVQRLEAEDLNSDFTFPIDTAIFSFEDNVLSPERVPPTNQ